MHSRCFLLHAACLAMGLLIGFGSNLVRSRGQKDVACEASPSSTKGAPPCAPSALTSPPDALNNPLFLASIRTAIREELRAELATHPFQGDVPHEEGRPPIKMLDAKDQERQRLAYDRASKSLSKAIGYGTWTQEDRQQFRSTLHDLSIPQQDQIIGELFGAIQSGRLRVQDSGPPL
ncbi:hypothetical protein [Archangium sp.]|uniref:hypothetical protein n=1 Tax=Archangium sp. TaxID=1872627 RepID=UPI002D6F89A8|nr:hypothetical protein [Archangium sp.]HYO55164.1 hypothetical protein [Archangium sp.]